MPAFVEDDRVYPTMLQLVSRAEDMIRRNGLPRLGWAGIITGSEEDVDCGQDQDCGTLWCRLDSIVPTTDFPTPEATPARCGVSLAATIEMGVKRCGVPFIDERGGMISVADAQSDVRTLLADMRALRAAIVCDADWDVVLNAWTPIPSDGSCFGGSWNFTVSEPI